MAKNTTKTLTDQFYKVYRHIPEKHSITKPRYESHMLAFIEYVGKEFVLLKLKNLKSQHIRAYAKALQGRGYTPKEIRYELCAVKFFHDHMENKKYPFPDIDELCAELVSE